MPATRKRQRSSPSPSSTAASSAVCRSKDEWEKLENGSVLMLPPTTSIVKEALHTLKDSAASGVVVKIAAFDMDDTVIKPASGGVFPRDDPTDWQWVVPEVRDYLQHLHQCGFLIALFSNQMGIGKGSSWNAAKADSIEAKVALLSHDAAVPLCACLATRDDAWRKPSPRIWHLFVTRVAQCVRDGCASSADAVAKEEVTVDCEAYSFYVGDAAGRTTPTLAGRKKDFSCADRHFAYNLQLPFFTPEQFFAFEVGHLLQEDALTTRRAGEAKGLSYRLSTALLRRTAPSSGAAATSADFSWGDVCPEELRSLPRTYAQLSVQVITFTTVKTISLPSAPPLFARTGEQELIIFVGFPGCGKSSFYRRHLQPYGYAHVNRDILQTRAKCIRAAEEHWARGDSVVVDNTNPTVEDRQAYIDVVKKHTPKRNATAVAVLPVRIFCFTHSRGLASHMNVVRAHVEGVPRVPAIAYNVFQNKLQRPTTTEEVAALGIEAVWGIPPVVCFDDAPVGTEKAFSLLL
ncbi:putative polynucleotide kinase 3'-phosphatase [Leptomonas pyrrhocoris]|uniref:Putative polynucleotide kinase 3'-phosphatase n=1 Tax=Leptomonas pyrrhocoris TaxID=157538 RepID=A0A0N0DXM5_LEPPY|nr:putative polynucleotide kinase 3'-phosphatase [Leptomonas pyrrhocoris]KPA82982.1 putative polynucleotide kinase 3'-phosphatase [Leptomonas pyrrhocoris]|eukprot:XP_015661421.1 putative polynucleotide kinase 3'-phosphatase [Leptomonas pyrrhocoris]